MGSFLTPQNANFGPPPGDPQKPPKSPFWGGPPPFWGILAQNRHFGTPFSRILCGKMGPKPPRSSKNPQKREIAIFTRILCGKIAKNAFSRGTPLEIPKIAHFWHFWPIFDQNPNTSARGRGSFKYRIIRPDPGPKTSKN